MAGLVILQGTLPQAETGEVQVIAPPTHPSAVRRVVFPASTAWGTALRVNLISAAILMVACVGGRDVLVHTAV